MNAQRPSALQVLEVQLTMDQFHDVAGLATRPLQVALSYDPADPYAVTMTAHVAPANVRWTFSRELLTDGVYEPTGDGDVHVWPCLDTMGTSVVMLELSSPDGGFLGQLATRDIVPFIRDMLAAVPLGRESEQLDIDALVERLADPPTQEQR